MKKLIWLAAGVVITLLMFVFKTTVLEALYYDAEFSNEMYNENLYFTVMLIVVSVAWVAAALYYYAINSVRFSRWYHWLVVMAVVAVLVPVLVYQVADGTFSDYGFDFSRQLVGFCTGVCALEIVLYTVASFAVRWWSSNCRHTPFPE